MTVAKGNRNHTNKNYVPGQIQPKQSHHDYHPIMGTLLKLNSKLTFAVKLWQLLLYI